jgi:diaminopimelate epimerase
MLVTEKIGWKRINMQKIIFHKMHGLGNDFVIINEQENQSLKLDESLIKLISDRNYGVGCDQLIVLKSGISNLYDVEMLIYNQDGSRAEACGNATRSVGLLFNKDKIFIKVGERILEVNKKSNGVFEVNMGKINKVKKVNDYTDLIKTQAYYAEIGNPHLIFFQDSYEGIDLNSIGKKMQSEKIFPNGVNVSFASIKNNNLNLINLQVWERGVGLTNACGSGATAVGAIAIKLGFVENNVKIIQPGGELEIAYLAGGEILMSGPANYVFYGEFIVQ